VLLGLCCWVLQLGDQTNLMLGLHICTLQALLLSWLLLLLLMCAVGLEGRRCAAWFLGSAAAGVTGSSTSCLHWGQRQHIAAQNSYNVHTVWRQIWGWVDARRGAQLATVE
jgi:hypothetical protein